MFHHIETSHLIYKANQLNGFNMMETMVVKELMNINLITIFKVVLTLYVVVALKLNQPYFLLHCYHFSNMGSISNVDDYTLVKTLLFGDQNHSQEENSYITNATV